MSEIESLKSIYDHYLRLKYIICCVIIGDETKKFNEVNENNFLCDDTLLKNTVYLSP